MQKKALVIIGIVALLAVAAGGYFMMNKSSNAPQESVSVETSATQEESPRFTKGSIKSLLSSGKNVMCTMKYPVDEETAEGISYVSGNKVRGDFNINVGGKPMESHMIIDGDYMYSWTSATNQGVKLKIDETGTPSASPTNESFDPEQEVDLECSSWSVDSSKFEVPTNVNFVEISASVKQSQQQTKTGSGVPASVCDQITDPQAKASCMQATGN